ncbi:hypothetical protein [Cryptosporangium phraense]|uniref:Uncharacterized protein n=1 Tax=Cryptosporangium phraense TaxID=2593070 RepID=A0A545AML4_9ACTN|nr:hypothetical protein [Cryptosporangium phraense]TQS42584.1 hypothetical protein FL583_23100 [Cryptosporangium phraense]
MTSLQTTEIAPVETYSLRPIEWPAAPPPPTEQRPRRRLLAAALVGLVCGAFLVGSVWLGGSLLGRPADGPAKDVADACTILRGLPEFSAGNFTLSDGTKLNRASELSAAAARSDEQYRALARTTRQAYLSSSDLDLVSVNQQVRIALAECGR